jgi:hypothetical protein
MTNMYDYQAIKDDKEKLMKQLTILKKLIFNLSQIAIKTSALQFASSVSLSINAIISELTLLERMSDMLVEANKNLGK